MNSSLARSISVPRRIAGDLFRAEKANAEIFQLTRAFDTFSTCRRLSYLLRAYRNTREREMLSSTPSGVPFNRTAEGDLELRKVPVRRKLLLTAKKHYRRDISVIINYIDQ